MLDSADEKCLDNTVMHAADDYPEVRKELMAMKEHTSAERLASRCNARSSWSCRAPSSISLYLILESVNRQADNRQGPTLW